MSLTAVLAAEIRERLERFAKEDPLAGGDPIGLPFDPVLLSADVAAALRALDQEWQRWGDLRERALAYQEEMQGAEADESREQEATNAFFRSVVDMLDDLGLLSKTQQQAVGLLDDELCDDDDDDAHSVVALAPKCDVCGCTDDAPCTLKGWEKGDPDGACSWVAPNLCNACVKAYKSGDAPRLLQSGEGAGTVTLYQRLKRFGMMGLGDLTLGVRRGEAAIEQALNAAHMLGQNDGSKHYAALMADEDSRWGKVQQLLRDFHARVVSDDAAPNRALIWILLNVFCVTEPGPMGRKPCEPGEHVVSSIDPNVCSQCGVELGPIMGFFGGTEAKLERVRNILRTDGVYTDVIAKALEALNA